MEIFTTNILFDLLTIFVALVVVTITVFKWKFNYWKRKGVPSMEPSIPFGNATDLFLGRVTLGVSFGEFYKYFKSRGLKYGGVYMGATPNLIPVDSELIKNILVKDFQHFVNHGAFIDEENDPLTGHLFNLEDEKWRNMRVKLTPTFTSGKMKMMFQTLADCTVGLNEIMSDSVQKKEPIDIKEILGRFTTDIIGSAAFGLECNSLKNPNAEFRIYGKKTFQVTTWDRVKNVLTFALPHGLLKAMKLRIIKQDVENFFMKVVRDTVNYREKNNIYRKDFMHLLLQLKNRGTISDDSKITENTGQTAEKALTMNELTAQAFVFFLAGFETSSTTMTFALLELARNPDLQQRLRTEINAVLSKHDNKLSYDAIMEMTYMDKVINGKFETLKNLNKNKYLPTLETLRKYPPVPMLPRQCTKDYRIPGTDIVIEKGTRLGIPVYGLHHDEEYYPNPDRFDPDRFTEENKQKRPHYAWIPFGEGPRICIGLRFGVLQSKVGLTALLKNYEVKLSPKTHLPLKFEDNSFVLTADGGIWLDVQKV